MALQRHLFFGGATHITAHHAHPILKPSIGYWAPFDHSALIPTSSSSSSTFLLLHGSSAANPNSGSPSSTSSPPCGTCIYKGAQWDDWIIRLAQFAVEQHNHKEVPFFLFLQEIHIFMPICESFDCFAVVVPFVENVVCVPMCFCFCVIDWN